MDSELTSGFELREAQPEFDSLDVNTVKEQFSLSEGFRASLRDLGFKNPRGLSLSIVTLKGLEVRRNLSSLCKLIESNLDEAAIPETLRYWVTPRGKLHKVKNSHIEAFKDDQELNRQLDFDQNKEVEDLVQIYRYATLLHLKVQEEWIASSTNSS